MAIDQKTRDRLSHIFSFDHLFSRSHKLPEFIRPIHQVVEATQAEDHVGKYGIGVPWMTVYTTHASPYAHLIGKTYRGTVVSEIRTLSVTLCDSLVPQDQRASEKGTLLLRLSGGMIEHARLLMYKYLAESINERAPELSVLLGNYMEKAYEIGGYPCGWSGEFPRGHLLVFYPFDQDGRYIPQKIPFGFLTIEDEL